MAIFARIGRLFQGFLSLFISGIEARNPEAGFFELLREVRGRSLTSSSTGDTSLGSDVDPAAQEGARGDYNAFCAKAPSFQSLDAKDAPFV